MKSTRLPKAHVNLEPAVQEAPPGLMATRRRGAPDHSIGAAPKVRLPQGSESPTPCELSDVGPKEGRCAGRPPGVTGGRPESVQALPQEECGWSSARH